MSTKKENQLEGEFATSYWSAVEKVLIRLKFTPLRAKQAVHAYQLELKHQGIGAIVYHQDVADAAAGAKALDERKRQSSTSSASVETSPKAAKRRKLA